MLIALLDRPISLGNGVFSTPTTNSVYTNRVNTHVKAGLRQWEKPGTGALGFSVEKVQLATEDTGTRVPDAFAVRRVGTDTVYGTVGGRYSLIQPSDVGDIADEFAKMTGGAVERSYSLDAGGRFGAVVAMPGHLEIGTSDDKQVKCVTFDSGNDGGTPFSAAASCLRLVCHNQYHALLRDMASGRGRGLKSAIERGRISAKMTIRHTRSGTDRVRQMHEIMTRMMQAFEFTEETMRAMQARIIDLKGGELKTYYTAIMPDPVKPEPTGNRKDDSKALEDWSQESSKVTATRRCWFNTFEEERTALCEDPNLWLAYNSATKWMQHNLGLRGIAQNPERRAFSNLPGGKAYELTELARDAAMAMIRN